MVANRVATAVRRIREVDYTIVTVAGDGAGTRNTATVYTKLKPLEARSRDVFEVVAEIRADILPAHVPANVRTSVAATGGMGSGGGNGGDIQFVMQGPDLRQLQTQSERMVAKTKEIPGLVDVDTNLNTGKPEWSVRLDRPKAADLGVQISDAADALRLLVGGDQVTTYNEGGEQYEVHVRADARDRTSQDAIALLPVPSSRLGSVTLDNVASFAPDTAPTEIRRLNRLRQVTVVANMVPGTSQAGAQQQMLDASAELGLGPEYRLGFTGRSRELNRTASAFLSAFVLSLIFMYLVLAAQFESWLHPVTILLSLPLTLPFALISIAHLRAVAEHLLGARPARPVRRGEEELDPADRPRQSASGVGSEHARRRGPREPRPPPADSDDDAGVRGRDVSARDDERRGVGHQPCDRIRGDRRADARAGADAHRHAGGILAVRRDGRTAVPVARTGEPEEPEGEAAAARHDGVARTGDPVDRRSARAVPWQDEPRGIPDFSARAATQVRGLTDRFGARRDLRCAAERTDQRRCPRVSKGCPSAHFRPPIAQLLDRAAPVSARDPLVDSEGISGGPCDSRWITVRWRLCATPLRRNQAGGDFHLRHRGSAVIAVEPGGAASEQLLGAQRRQRDEFKSVEVNGTRHHHAPALLATRRASSHPRQFPVARKHPEVAAFPAFAPVEGAFDRDTPEGQHVWPVAAGTGTDWRRSMRWTGGSRRLHWVPRTGHGEEPAEITGGSEQLHER